jgi:Asp-tRNA(Asn)/Glu-tRNA(Gln) amidotransferase A subunit family amidase
MTDLHYWTAAEALRLFRARELSPGGTSQRGDQTRRDRRASDQRLRGDLYQPALDQARAAEARYAGRAGMPPLPLDGLPVAVKEEAEIAGQRFRHWQPTTTRASRWDERPHERGLDGCADDPAFNIASRCPVMSVPSGLSRDNVPTPLSVVGKTYDDVTVFRIAAAHEEQLTWLDAPARRPAL